MTDAARGEGVSDRALDSDARELAARWVEIYGRLAEASAHGLKNQLNAIAVNLEVVRTRSARGGEAGSVASFAETATNEFERATSIVEAMLSLARPEREPADVGMVLARIVVLAGIATGSATVTISRLDDAPMMTSAPGLAVRVAVASVLQSALLVGGVIACDLAGTGGILLRISGSLSGASPPDEPIADLLRRCGIGVRSIDASVELTFPAPGR